MSKLLEVRFNKLKKEIRRTPCVECEGTGSIPEKKTIICPKCSGKGWHGAANLEIVCETCEGAGKVREISECPCDKCSGRGHFISIFEIKKRRVKCASCPKDNQVEDHYCEICGGSGKDPDIQTCAFCCGTGSWEGEDCSYCSAKGIVTVNDFGDRYYQSDYQSDQNEIKCEHCGGNGLISRPATCDACNLKGYYWVSKEKDVTPNLG